MSVPATRPGSLWRNRDFPLFWFIQALSALGDSFSLIAIPLLVLHATGSIAKMGLLTGLAGAALIVAGIFAGALVDRVDRRTLLIGCDLARAVVYALIPLVWLHSPQIWLLFVVAPIGGAVGMIFQVGYVAAVPNLVDPAHITRANGQLYASYAAAGIGGPLLAGLVSGMFGPTAAIAIDANTFAVSALGLCFVRLRALANPQTGEPARPPASEPIGTPAGPPAAAPANTSARSSWSDLLVGRCSSGAIRCCGH